MDQHQFVHPMSATAMVTTTPSYQSQPVEYKGPLDCYPQYQQQPQNIAAFAQQQPRQRGSFLSRSADCLPPNPPPTRLHPERTSFVYEREKDPKPQLKDRWETEQRSQYTYFICGPDENPYGPQYRPLQQGQLVQSQPPVQQHNHYNALFEQRSPFDPVSLPVQSQPAIDKDAFSRTIPNYQPYSDDEHNDNHNNMNTVGQQQQHQHHHQQQPQQHQTNVLYNSKLLDDENRVPPVGQGDDQPKVEVSTSNDTTKADGAAGTQRQMDLSASTRSSSQTKVGSKKVLKSLSQTQPRVGTTTAKRSITPRRPSTASPPKRRSDMNEGDQRAPFHNYGMNNTKTQIEADYLRTYNIGPGEDQVYPHVKERRELTHSYNGWKTVAGLSFKDSLKRSTSPSNRAVTANPGPSATPRSQPSGETMVGTTGNTEQYPTMIVHPTLPQAQGSVQQPQSKQHQQYTQQQQQQQGYPESQGTPSPAPVYHMAEYPQRVQSMVIPPPPQAHALMVPQPQQYAPMVQVQYIPPPPPPPPTVQTRVHYVPVGYIGASGPVDVPPPQVTTYSPPPPPPPQMAYQPARYSDDDNNGAYQLPRSNQPYGFYQQQQPQLQPPPPPQQQQQQQQQHHYHKHNCQCQCCNPNVFDPRSVDPRSYKYLPPQYTSLIPPAGKKTPYSDRSWMCLHQYD